MRETGSRRQRDVRVRRVLKEQEALRRVATLVARGASPSQAFWGVARELGRLLGADYATVARFESDRTVCQLACWRDPRAPAPAPLPFGKRWPMGEDPLAAELYRAGRPVRLMTSSIGSEFGGWLHSQGVVQVVACPVMVDGRLWGRVGVWFVGSRSVPDDIEVRMGEFVELVACTIAQAEYRAELIASRARLISASDATRRRIERDLHDGAQTRLVALGLALREAEERASGVDAELGGLLERTADGLSEVLTGLQEISRGLHPAVLTQAGLGPAIRTLMRRCPVPAELRITGDRRLPESIEITIYYVVAEALANVLKHASASTVHIDLSTGGGVVQLVIHDDGVGGADPRRGSGLIGLEDRVDAVEGTLEISSPVGGGTSLLVSIPPQA
jgi:signal transduction histidine kinase